MSFFCLLPNDFLIQPVIMSTNIVPSQEMRLLRIQNFGCATLEEQDSADMVGMVDIIEE